MMNEFDLMNAIARDSMTNPSESLGAVNWTSEVFDIEEMLKDLKNDIKKTIIGVSGATFSEIGEIVARALLMTCPLYNIDVDDFHNKLAECGNIGCDGEEEFCQSFWKKVKNEMDEWMMFESEMEQEDIDEAKRDQ